MDNCSKPIGVFDSGLGGISVLKDLTSLMPNENFIYYGDSLHAPYGIKSKEDIVKRCIDICEFLIKKDVKAIVIACNTATSAAVNALREIFKAVPIIGMEPALKVVAENAVNNKIVVMATKLTLSEEKFNNLMKKYSDKNNIIKMPCPELVNIVENDMLDDIKLINNQIMGYYENIDFDTLDSIVLGCTHFVFFKNHLRDILGSKIKIIDGNLGTAKRLKDILEKNHCLCISEEKGNIIFLNSHSDDKYIVLSEKLFDY